MKFSIVVATYNRREALEKCVEGVLSQTYRNFELLIVDDGSTDGTAEYMKQVNDGRVTYHRLSKNHGCATVARNWGIEHMTGDALIIWDSDDVLFSNALETLGHIYEREEHLGLVCANTEFYKGTTLEKFESTPSGFMTKLDWFAGKRPRSAEIIAVKKDLIKDTRFEARNIDFIFYAKIIADSNPIMYFVNKICGAVYLESDELSLTKMRRKTNPVYSMERAPIIDDFLIRYGSVYKEVGAFERYAGLAYGASVGLLLLGKKKKAVYRSFEAFCHGHDLRHLFFAVFAVIPFSSQLFNFFLWKK